ncbi:MAG TPA: MnhB domain-containing protein [Gaiellaceae bacterium]|nr:MnhB domain-containing protein [Gaiellaceae bacterium]
MSRRIRIAVLGPALLGLGALFAWAIAGLPAFGDYRGPYGYVLNRVVVPLRHTTNVVMGTTFDVRGVDTMGEEFILYAAVLGVMLLLRDETRSRQAERRTRRLPSDAVRLVGGLMVGGGVLVGLWLMAFGYITPGGGFQGGVLFAGGILLLYLVGSHRDYRPFRIVHALDPLESLGAGGYVIIGLAALASGTAFLTDLLGLGTAGTLRSGGSIPLLNWASAIAVSCAMLILFAEFLETYVVPLEPEDAGS